MIRVRYATPSASFSTLYFRDTSIDLSAKRGNEIWFTSPSAWGVWVLKRDRTCTLRFAVTFGNKNRLKSDIKVQKVWYQCKTFFFVGRRNSTGLDYDPKIKIFHNQLELQTVVTFSSAKMNKCIYNFKFKMLSHGFLVYDILQNTHHKWYMCKSGFSGTFMPCWCAINLEQTSQLHTGIWKTDFQRQWCLAN